MNALNSKHNKSSNGDNSTLSANDDKLTIEQQTNQAMERVQNLCKQAYQSGYTVGYKRGVEFGVSAAIGKVPRQ